MRIPLTFPDYENNQASASDRGSSLEDALEYYLVGNFADAHSIVQDDASAEAAYIHGMLHRREGDYSNARYWFQRARGSALYSFVKDSIEAFEPLQFVDQCQRAETGLETQKAEQLQYSEWAKVKEFIAKRVGVEMNLVSK